MASPSPSSSGLLPQGERPSKRAKLLPDDSSDESSSDASGGVALNKKNGEAELKINEDYARRFEHNHKRAELHRLEEKYGPAKARTQAESSANGNGQGTLDEEDESSSDEEEDDDGVLASGALDDEVNATLRAIRSKDPRVYDTKSVFYTSTDGVAEPENLAPTNKEKPMYLNDYHRENLLRGAVEQDDEGQQPTYAQQQVELKDSIVQEMHAAGPEDQASDSDDDGADDAFLVAKKPLLKDKTDQEPKVAISSLDIETAEKHPDTFLSKFLDSRAWVPTSENALHPFESDDDEEEIRAEAFEEAYNLRFENPEGANEKLVSHARDTVAKYSVRQEPTNKRKRAREADQAKKDETQSQKQQEKALLRKLRLEEAESKLKRIKDAAGLGKRAVMIEEWQDILTEDWDDQRWEAEMKEKFGDDYYADDSPAESVEGSASHKKSKKPKWSDEIDITDLVPDFEADENGKISLSSEEDAGEQEATGARPLSGKQRKRERDEIKKEGRKERRKLEQLVDEKLDLDMALNGNSKGNRSSHFRYRDSSPLAFGLTAQDILMASDTQLNQFAGLKKMAAYRDPERRKKDKKHLGKKARLRQWRKETFGNEHGPQNTIQDMLRDQTTQPEAAKAIGDDRLDAPEGKKRKRRKRKSER